MAVYKKGLDTSLGGALEDKSENYELGTTLNVKTQIKYNQIKKCVRIKEDLVG